MALTSGTRLGPYEIIAPIGAGGMGEVYEATDTRLDRTVAIKVLPEHLAENPERKGRFEREAKAISQLNHPHICTLYDVGDKDGVDFIVMEYIEGETLTERLKKGALNLAEALEYGIQIADGLDTGHRAGIVHRDLKPSNVMLTQSGVKLLDYGLAKLVEQDDVVETSDAPTRQKDLTQAESIIGTLQYMAPEQLEGKAADHRADIWAFGAVLYEMITGNKAFEGESQASLIGAILKDDPPPMSKAVPISPAALDRVVGTCLAKERDERWQSVGDVGRQLQWVVERDSHLADEAVTAPRRWTRDLAWAGVGAFAALVIGLAVWALAGLSQPESRAPRRFTLALPEGVQLPSLGSPLGISRDGRTLLFMGDSNSGRQLFRRSMDQLNPVPIPDVRGHVVEVSPDGERLAFYTGAELRTAPMTGGPSTLLYDGDVRGISWGADDAIIFGLQGSGLHRIPAAGGPADAITTVEPGETHGHPRVLPGGRAVLYTIVESGSDEDQIAVVSLTSGEQRTLITGDNARYAVTGHLVFGRKDSVWAVVFDPESLEMRGSPVRVLDNVTHGVGSGGTYFTFAENGSLVYAPSGAIDEGVRTFVWVDLDGREEPMTAEPRIYRTFRLSPDGDRLAVTVGAYPEADLWIHDFLRTTFTRLTLDPAEDTNPLWTPDGTGIVFGSLRDGGGLFMRAADGTGEVERLSEHEEGVDAAMPMAWSSDGENLLVRHRRRARGAAGKPRILRRRSRRGGCWRAPPG